MICFFKRLFDVIVASTIVIVSIPVGIILALFIYGKLGFPIFFRQQRPGLNGKPFEIIKFRTMLDSVDSNGKVLPDADRLTVFGKFLRSTSLDELPELWNVLKGDMSLVGPRPLLKEYLPLYSKEQARRHEVRPGITGWAQVNGRNAISWDEKFELDVWYVDNNSLLLDIKILLMTVKKVLCRADISASQHVTMDKFRGNQE